MNVSDYVRYDAVGLAQLIRQKQVDAAEVLEAAIGAFRAIDPTINAVVETWPADAQLDALPDDAPLAGVPFLLKDVAVAMRGHATEFGSRLASGISQPEDSGLMTRFHGSGLVTFGRTSIPEMAYSTTTESVAYGACRNPWDPSRSPGGSSGGAAAAVAAGVVPVAHATDGLGSIRLPAAWCGLVGLKPSRGRVSDGPHVAEGLSALGVQFGLSRSVRDAAALLDAVHGPAVGEPYEIAAPARPYFEEIGRDPGKLRIGLVAHSAGALRLDGAIAQALEDVGRLLSDLGHDVEPATLDIGVSWEGFVVANARMWNPNLVNWCNAFASASGRPIDASTLEAATLACYRHGLQVSAADYLQAQDVRNVVTRRIGEFFAGYDVLLSPTVARMPIAIGAYLDDAVVDDALAWFAKLFSVAAFTAVFNVSGTPAMSLPLAVEPVTGLPIGIQVAAAFGREDLLFRLAGQVETARGWSGRTPRVWAGDS